ncbi:MAG TPA: MFS transporter [Steroidobacteraceae bacterium]|nr:MFS transporter [Steroidobacteraceae bacterium]
MAVLLLIVFVDLLGFGIVGSTFPYAMMRAGAPDWLVVWGGPGVFSIFQMMAAPIWGRLSDAYGRKPIFIASLSGAVCSYVMLASAGSTTMLLAARAVGGFMAGNLGAAFAYATDSSTPETRAKTLGFMGTAFGAGFTLGPVVGGAFAGNDIASFSLMGPAITGALTSCLALAGSIFVLKESLRPENRRPLSERHPGARSPLLSGLKIPGLSLVLSAAWVMSVVGTTMQAAFPLWGTHYAGMSPKLTTWLLLLSAVGATIGQGVAVGMLTRYLGERRVAQVGGLILAAGLVILWLAPLPIEIGCANFLIGFGLGIFQTCGSTLTTFFADPRQRGAILAGLQNAQSLGRIVGPGVAAICSAHIGHSAPFWVSALMVLPALWLIQRVRLPETVH